jgi:hypothetical protein
MRLGEGYSVEEQLTGKGDHGGLQVIVYPMKGERFERSLRKRYKQSMWLLNFVTLHAFSDQGREALPTTMATTRKRERARGSWPFSTASARWRRRTAIRCPDPMAKSTRTPSSTWG